MRSTAALLGLAALLAGVVLPGCAEQELPGDLREPRCEPRKTTAPGRLNFDTSAEHYGLRDPCESSISLYIAGNSDLRAVEGRLGVKGPDGETLRERLVSIELDGPDSGMYHHELHAAPVDGHDCRSLTLDFEVLACRDGENNRIDCPDIRVKTSMVLADFMVHGTDLNVCFDD